MRMVIAVMTAQVCFGALAATGLMERDFTPEPSTVWHLWEGPQPDPTWTVTNQFSELPGTVHSLIFYATEATGAYNHHANLAWWGGKFHAVWSNQRHSEDAPGQRALYASSVDGLHWSDPREMIPSIVPETSWENSYCAYVGANEFVEWDGRLFGSAVVFEVVEWHDAPRKKVTQTRTRESCVPEIRGRGRIYREIGAEGPINCPFVWKRRNFLPNLTLTTPVRDMKEMAKGFQAPKRDYNLNDAVRQNPHGRIFSEPTVWRLPDGQYAVMFRDDKRSFRKWVSLSKDGQKWSEPRPTDIPDAPSLSRVIRLSNGLYVLVGNHRPGLSVGPDWRQTRQREPLMISTSRDGLHFGNTHAVRIGFQQVKVPWVRGGHDGGGQYPYVLEHDGFVYVMYSMGKEDIWVTRIPTKEIK